MSRADLIGLVAIALAYFLGASQASTAAQARGYALLALMILVYGVGVALLSRVPIERLLRVGKLLDPGRARSKEKIDDLRAQVQTQRNADNRYHAQTVTRLKEQIATLTRERDEALTSVEFWQYQARSGTEDEKLTATYTEIHRLMVQVERLEAECEGLRRANGRRKEDRP